MDPHNKTHSPSQIHTFPDYEGSPDDVPENWIPNATQQDALAPLNDLYFPSAESSDLWAPWGTLEPPPFDQLEQGHLTSQPHIDESPESFQNATIDNIALGFHPATQSSVSKWPNGAFCPPTPCTHCRRHRLQCLIIRTTAANPNPVSACSSCVALFRECSLSKGEKRLPSGFETFTPVLGHLHGLPEDINDDGNRIIPSVEDTEGRKDTKQFVRKGARILREWFYQNQELPYPTAEQKDRLSQETGFSDKRISTWFANARRRQKQKLQTSRHASTTRHRAGSPMITDTLSSMTPMERWKASPPEDEPVAESVIQDAIASNALDITADLFDFDMSTMDLFNFDESSSHLPSSASSFGSRASETSGSISSAWSHHSEEGNIPFPLLPKKRRSRRRDATSEEHQFQCTFCTRSFKKRHDWARHEKSVHISFENWVCTPELNELQLNGDVLATECKFCDTFLPGPTHYEEHEFQICAAKPPSQRSFTRKDHLWQHLRKFHGCTKSPIPDLDAWRGSGVHLGSRCGFCDCPLQTWSERTEHLVGHFRDGMRMDQWVGDWGLDPSAMAILRHAVLPNQRTLEH
ncbi:hypothetical protein N7528_001285 [Penicillium herquei]|nr:hypothetical protein N7528_001285 [Penicillium herquei]